MTLVSRRCSSCEPTRVSRHFVPRPWWTLCSAKHAPACGERPRRCENRRRCKDARASETRSPPPRSAALVSTVGRQHRPALRACTCQLHLLRQRVGARWPRDFGCRPAVRAGDRRRVRARDERPCARDRAPCHGDWSCAHAGLPQCRGGRRGRRRCGRGRRGRRRWRLVGDLDACGRRQLGGRRPCDLRGRVESVRLRHARRTTRCGALQRAVGRGVGDATGRLGR